MTTTPRPAGGVDPTRRSRGRPQVPLDRIVATALRIVDEEGADALSMRTLAQRLDSGTATLYRHFANRADLVAHVVDRMFGEIDWDAGRFASTGWLEACRAAAQAMFDTVSRHKNAAPLLVEQVPTGPNAMVHRERCVAILLDDGFPPHLAARAYATLARYVLGFAIQLTVPDPAAHADDSQLAATFRDLDPSRFPAIAAVADSLPVPIEEEFAFGLDLILNGLDQLRDSST